jgi:hypothetical protein
MVLGRVRLTVAFALAPAAPVVLVWIAGAIWCSPIVGLLLVEFIHRIRDDSTHWRSIVLSCPRRKPLRAFEEDAIAPQCSRKLKEGNRVFASASLRGSKRKLHTVTGRPQTIVWRSTLGSTLTALS